MPACLRLDAAGGTVRRGDAVRLRWAIDEAPEDHELRLALVVHHKRRASTLEGLGPDGRFGVEQQVWAVHDRAPLADGEAQLRVPADAPYSYPGTILAFFWGVALAAPGTPVDRPLGWAALRVLP
jgi:hypothetical protein